MPLDKDEIEVVYYVHGQERSAWFKCKKKAQHFANRMDAMERDPRVILPKNGDETND